MGKVRPLDETTKAFEHDSHFHNIFRYNQFSEDIEFFREPEWERTIEIGKIIDDDDLTQIRYYLTNVHKIEPSKQIVGEACFIVSKRNQYHPLKSYIQKEKWDGVKRIDEWLINAVGCDDNVYYRQAGSKFLIAAVNRVYNPGCKFDHMMILEGAQGLGKSTLVEELAGEWYLDTNFDNKDKDLVDCMRKAFLIEISELSGMGKKDVDWLKSFITKKVDTVRLAYAARTKNFKRKSVFIGTYNPSGNNNYFRDDTGNRRFWPIECRTVNIDYIRKNKHQLWAEAYSRYIDKEQYYISDPEAITIMKTLHAERETEGPAFVKIKRWLSDNNPDEVSIENIIEMALGIKTEGKDPRDLHSTWTIVGIVLKRIGWIKGSNDKRHIYYNPNPKEDKGWEE